MSESGRSAESDWMSARDAGNVTITQTVCSEQVTWKCAGGDLIFTELGVVY